MNGRIEMRRELKKKQINKKKKKEKCEKGKKFY